jgi:hypothetical protein
MSAPTVVNQQTGEVISLARTCFECNENPVDYTNFGLCHEIMCTPCAVSLMRDIHYAEMMEMQEKARKKCLRSVKCGCGARKQVGYYKCFDCHIMSQSS